MPLGDWLYDQDANKFNNSYFRDANNTGFAVDMSGDLIVRGRVGIGTPSPIKTLSLMDSNGGMFFSLNESTYNRIKSHTTSTTSGRDLLISPTDAGTSGIYLKSNGNVGIGTTSPQHGLHIPSGVNSSKYVNGYIHIPYQHTTTIQTEATPTTHTINAYIHRIGCTYVMFDSDRRIKKNIVDVEDDSALVKLRQIRPKRYDYIDTIERGTRTVYGFIAQEIQEIIPEATILKKDKIPNIFQFASVEQDKKTLCFFQGFNTDELESNSNTLVIMDKENTEHLVNIEEVIDASSIRVDIDLSEYMIDIDGSGNVIEGNKIFIYGQKIDDFHNLDKNAIWTVATAALQEVDRQLQAEKAKTATLESQLADVLTRLTALENA